MATANSIKEFLVALGFKIDEAGLKKFVTKIEEASKEVLKFTGTMTAAATAVGVAVIDIADHLEDLYFSSQRIGASVGNLKAFQYAASQMGVSAEQARTTLEGLARSLRENPGFQGMLQGLGVQTRGRQTTDVMIDLVSRLKQMPFFVAQQYAGQLGIDSDTLFMLERNLPEMVAHQKELADAFKESGVNADDAAGKGHKLMVALRRIQAEVDVLKAGLVSTLEPVGEVIVGVVEKVMHFALWLNKVTHGWSTVAVTFVASSEGIAIVGNLLFRILGIGLRIPGVFSLISGALGAMGVVIEATPLGWIITALGALAIVGYEIWKHWHDIGPMFHKTMQQITSAVTGNNVVGRAYKWVMGGLGYNLDGAPKHHTAAHHAARTIASAAQRAGTAIGSSNVRSRALQAWSSLQSSGHFAGADIAAIIGNLWWESSGLFADKPGDSGLAYGLAQWHRARARDFMNASTKLFGHKESLYGASAADQLKFVDYELSQGKYKWVGEALKKAHTLAEKVWVLNRFYESPANPLGSQSQRLGRAMAVISLQAKSEIHVHGDSNPRQTAHIVHQHQKEHTAQIVRNLQGALT